MLKIVIVEDSAEHTQHLKTLLDVYQKRHEECSFAVASYSNPMRFLSEYSCDADLVFLDIQMPELDGVTVAKRIREVDSRVMLIFTTALAQYAIAGYEVQAFDYLLKPLKLEMFEAKLKRALRVVNYSHAEEWIDVSTKTQTRKVYINHILYIEVSNHDILIHTDQGIYQHWGTLKEYEQKLAPLHFVRCNTCYLLNMKHVSCIRSDTVMVGGDELPISRSKRKEFLVAFAKYKGGSQ